MTLLLKDYPRKKTRDLRSAMAETLAQYLGTIPFNLPASAPVDPNSATQKACTLAASYDSWAEFEDRALSSGGALPAAVVMPDEPEVYDSASLTPRMLEDTWVHDGQSGFALFEAAEAEVPLFVVVRAKSKQQIRAIVSAFEDAFEQDPDSDDSDPAKGQIRYGKLLLMRSYYQLHARYTLLENQVMDSQSLAAENRWMSQLKFVGHAPKCVVRRVQPLLPRSWVSVNGTGDKR